MNQFEIINFHFNLPSEQALLNGILKWLQVMNKDFDIDYYHGNFWATAPQSAEHATIAILFERKNDNLFVANAEYKKDFERI